MPVKVGKDEFCSKCMEWREYDEEGRCKVCHKVIKKIETVKEGDTYGDYTHESPSFEMDETENESEDY